MPWAAVSIEGWIGIAGGLSVLLFLGALVVIPLMIARLRPDYFVQPKRIPGPLHQQHPILTGLLSGTKNVFGALLLFTGLVMLLTPGQGLLTIFIGLTLMNYPGKYGLERWFITRRPIWRTVAWLRRKAGSPMLKYPGKATPHV